MQKRSFFTREFRLRTARLLGSDIKLLADVVRTRRGWLYKWYERFLLKDKNGASIDNGHSAVFPSSLLVWCVGFAYASVLALTLQKLVLPLLPGLHAEHGLLQNDAIVFHNAAAEIAARIGSLGWAEWRLFPRAGMTGNVGLLSLLYALFDPDPAWFIPFNAAAHATGALMLYLIGPVLWPGNVGRLGGLIAAGLYLAFPSALMWYGQNHKDAFCIAGTLLIVYVGCVVVSPSERPASGWRLLGLALGGAALIGFVRPYFLALVIAAIFFAWIVAVGAALIRRKLSAERGTLTAIFSMLVVVAALTQFIPHDREMGEWGGASEIPAPPSWVWHRSEILPQSVDAMFERVSRLRALLIHHGISVGAGSQIDNDRIPDDAASAIAYLPRALVVGLFAPFPDSWTERPTLIRVVGAVETLLWYALVPGLLMLMLMRPSRALVAGTLFCIAILTVLGFVNSNVGTLYRARFGVLFFFILCGAIGWSRIIVKMLSSVSRKLPDRACSPEIDSGAHSDEPAIMMRVAASGATVLAISFFTYLGFFIRDLLLVRTFGMSVDLDAFFSATMIPMFFVTFLSLPLADALTGPIFGLRGADSTRARQTLVQSFFSWAALMLLVVTVLLILTADKVIFLILGGHGGVDLDSAATMLRWFAPMLMFSVWTVVGNCLLNASNKARTAALAQLSVPIIVVTAVLIFSPTAGLYSAIYGMLVGVAVNALVVSVLVARQGFILLPNILIGVPELRGVVRNYLLLALAALLVAVATPINYAFAGIYGTVSTWALGSKLVQLFTGLAGIGIGAVILPHLGKLFAHERVAQLKYDLYFLLITGTWIAVGLTLIIVGFAEPFVIAVFEGGEVTHDQAVQLAAVLQRGSLQLPFVVWMTLIFKFTAVSGTSLRAVIGAGLGLVLNVVLNVILAPQSGVLGIATASVIATGLAAVYLSLSTRRASGLAWTEVLVLMASWIGLLGLSLGIHYHSPAASSTAGMVLAIVFAAQWMVWKKRTASIQLCPA